MYEKGRIQRDAAAQGNDAAMLRELRWTELVSQLAVTRELRAEVMRKPDELQIIGRFKSLSTGLADARAAPAAPLPVDSDTFPPNSDTLPTDNHQTAPIKRDAQ